MKMNNKMDMEQFAESIKEMLEQQGRFEKVDLQNVLKNNGVKRCGLQLYSDGNNLVPTIYLNSLFEEYKNGAGIEEIVWNILKIYGNASCRGVDISFFREFSAVKDKLCMRLVNGEANAELLKNIPHRRFLDMAIVYYVDYDDPQVGSGIIQVYNSHMEMWDVTEEELWEAARINTPERRPGRIENLEDVPTKVFAGQENVDNECCGCCMEESPVSILVITNAKRSYGAAVILYSSMLKQVSDKIGSDLFILPSSLHEVIAVPMIETVDAVKLKEMVIEVNRSAVPPEEVLSDNVYIYRRAQDRLEFA